LKDPFDGHLIPGRGYSLCEAEPSYIFRNQIVDNAPPGLRVADPALACPRARRCAADYQTRLSRPLLDRFDMTIELAPTPLAAILTQGPGEASVPVRERVLAARARANARNHALVATPEIPAHLRRPLCNAELDGVALDQAAVLEPEAQALMLTAADRPRLSAAA
jgi:magnesium chelatase family protein